MNIGVIGAGKLGLSFALLCAHKGFTVTASDKDTEYITKLQNKTHTTTEPFIEEYLKDSKDIIFTTSNTMVVNSSDIIFLFVPTPSLSSGEYDHQYIEQVIDSISGIDCTNKILVIGCTTMPEYTQSLIDRTGYDIVYNPEFIAQGDIINGLRTADMILIGTHNESSVHALTALYRAFMNQYTIKVNVMSPTAAELTKISINCYLTMKIAYANMIGEVAINSGIESEVSTILSAIGSDSRIGNKYLRYGFGYGGPCLPRDMKALGRHAIANRVYHSIPDTIDGSNNCHNMFLIKYYTKKNPDHNVPFIFPQLSYKKGVDMTIESQQLSLAIDLQEAGYTVYTTDTIQTHIPQLPVGVTGYIIEL